MLLELQLWWQNLWFWAAFRWPISIWNWLKIEIRNCTLEAFNTFLYIFEYRSCGYRVSNLNDSQLYYITFSISSIYNFWANMKFLSLPGKTYFATCRINSTPNRNTNTNSDSDSQIPELFRRIWSALVGERRVIGKWRRAQEKQDKPLPKHTCTYRRCLMHSRFASVKHWISCIIDATLLPGHHSSAVSQKTAMVGHQKLIVDAYCILAFVARSRQTLASFSFSKPHVYVRLWRHFFQFECGQTMSGQYVWVTLADD